jgi:hypothetical protein
MPPRRKKTFKVPEPKTSGEAIDLMGAGILYFKREHRLLFYAVVTLLMSLLGLNSGLLKDYFSTTRATVKEISATTTEFSLMPQAVAQARSEDGFQEENGVVIIRGKNGVQKFLIDPELRAWVLRDEPTVLVYNTQTKKGFTVTIDELAKKAKK